MPGEGLIRSIAHHLSGVNALPDEGRLPSFDCATAWINSQPLSTAELRGRVVLVGFWTYTCVNWLRTLPYLRAWNSRYADAGLTVVGVHTPEFDFEAELPNVTEHSRDLRIDYPIAVDSEYGIWNDFANHYWPAIYLADAHGRIRYHHYGEGEYAMTEMAIQQLIADSGQSSIAPELVTVEPTGLEVAADWSSLRCPETYLGYGQSNGFASERPAAYDQRHAYPGGVDLPLNSWDLTGEWTVTREAAVLEAGGGRVAFAFHARDVNLVMAPGRNGAAIPFRVFLDGAPVEAAHGFDVSRDGLGRLTTPNTYQLVRQPDRIIDRLVEIEFAESGAEVYCFTFG